MKSLIGIITFGLLFSNLTMAETNINNESEKEIHQIITQYETALNTSDSNAIIKLYGENSIFMPQNAPAQVGLDTIKKAYNGVFNNIKLNVKFTLHNIEILGNTAWARTSSSGKTKILANNIEVTEGNNELFIFKKENGSWKIHQYLFATSQPRQ